MNTRVFRKYFGNPAAATVFAVAALAALGASATLLSGCGGGGSALSKSGASTRSAKGSAKMRIVWPARKANSRLIPVAANSITAIFYQNDVEYDEQTITRPTDGSPSEVEFDDLPTGDFTVVTQAFPSTDGSGVADATATTDVTVVADTVTPIVITLDTTITAVTVSSAPGSIAIGTQKTLVATATDANGNTVLTNAITWTSLTPTIASVDANGVVTGLTTGTAQIQATETESGFSGIASVSVDSSTGVTITPLVATIAVNTTQAFRATVTAIPTQTVTWTASGGTITAAGLYTAPAMPGSYLITATSTVDQTVYGNATVTVQ